ncbi:MAG: glutamine synthetase III [Gracilibacteraceae bacterium]|jgi:glutamine synthetase|nr:glutamine synthetase III [Gracilibacteraceae bacterium]
MSANCTEIFGSMVFNDAIMKERLPKAAYKALKGHIRENTSLTLDVAHVVANAMKDWAIERGATHYTHWFQPMTGITAEKHDSFIAPAPDGKVIMEFSGKELIKGEPDASSFPSGGLRATFEARGYTAWDPTSYAFVKEGILCIPTVFYSYGGQVLDKKTPLLRSQEAINRHALRILRLFGDKATRRVFTTIGPEQEYFLLDRTLYEQRKDLVYCGRTLFGAKPPKGQEMEDHYFGSVKSRVAAYMKDLDEELWKLGIYAKTQHNEVAPSQHELAPIFSMTNTACDHNQLTMEIMKKVALRHNLVCLLHEKPFAGVNGSGKHNNWSMGTDQGANLLEPGRDPENDKQFLTFLFAVIKAVDLYQDLLRLSVATAANDHRLGANEAPPAIISVFLGDELTGIMDSIRQGGDYEKIEAREMDGGVMVLPHFLRDTTDRNRTSPFAFTGNKFEFRMLGSSLSIAGPNFIMNTIVAEVLDEFATELEKSDNFERALDALLKKTAEKHERIVFNGNNYAEEWVTEARKRGLLNLKSTPEALPYFCDDKNIRLFGKHNILTEEEIRSRCEILLENYSKTIHIEALTMLEMLKKDILPAVTSYLNDLTIVVLNKTKLELPPESYAAEKTLVLKLSSLYAGLSARADLLNEAVLGAAERKEAHETAVYYKDKVLPAMREARAVADELEANVGEKYWPYPTYGKLLFSV